MDGVKYLLVVAVLAGVGHCQQTFNEVVPNDLGNPDRCYDSTIDAFFSVGSVWWRPAQCNRLTCQRSDDPAFLNINGVRCEQITDVPANCKLTKSNLVALFPACCPRLICLDNSAEVQEIQNPVSLLEMPDKPVGVKVPTPINDDSIVKPVLNEDKVNTEETMEQASGETGAEEAADAEEPAVVLSSNPAEEVIPATMTITVADEIKPEEDSASQENMNEEVKLPVAMDKETIIPDAVAEETKQPEAMEEEIKKPLGMDDETIAPVVISEDTKIPEVMVEETKEAEALVEETKPDAVEDDAIKPEAMVEGTKEPEAMVEETKEPEAMVEETKEPEAMVEETKEPEAMVEETKEPEAMAEETKKPEAMVEETKEPEAMAEETKEPEAMVEETKEPEAMAEETKEPEAMAEETKKPEAMKDDEMKPVAIAEETKPDEAEEKPLVPTKEETLPAVDSAVVPDKLTKPVQPIYDGGVGLGMKCGPPTYQSCRSDLECRNKICQYPIKVIPIQNAELVAGEKPTAEEPVKEVVATTEGKLDEVPQTTEETTTVAEEKPLLPGYERHSTGNYKFNKRMVTWTRAKSICEAEGTHLAIVNSDEESKILMKMFDRYPENYWQPKYRKIVFASIGFNDIAKEGQYETVLGEPLSSTGFARFWRKNEPNNLGASKSRPGEDCGAIHRNGGLNDFFCSIHLPFICEQK